MIRSVSLLEAYPPSRGGGEPDRLPRSSVHGSLPDGLCLVTALIRGIRAIRKRKVAGSHSVYVSKPRDFIAHNRDRVLPRVIISVAFPHAVRRVHARRSPSLLEDLPVAKTPDADRVRGGSEGEQDGEHREQLARVAVCPKHAEEAFDRPIDDRELAQLLHELRHEAGRPPGAADRAHGQDEQRAHAVRRRGRRRERGEQHAEGNAGTCRGQTDEE